MVSLCKLEDFASAFAPYIDELHDFFRSRSVRFGSAEDVAALVERLSGDEAFRDEMASMVRAIIYRERDGLTPVELFELMVVAVGGPRVEEGSEEIQDSAGQLLAFVRGVCRSRWKTDVDVPSGFESAGETVDGASTELDERSKGPEQEVETAEAGELRSGMSEVEIASSDAETRANISEAHMNSALFYRARVVAAERHEPGWPMGPAAPMEWAAMRAESTRVEGEAPIEWTATRSEEASVTARRPLVNWSTLKLPTVNWPALTWPSVTLPAGRWPTLSLSWLRRVGSGSRRWMWGAGLCALGVAVGAGLWVHDRAGVAATSVRRVAQSPADALAVGKKPSPAVKNLRDEDVAAMIFAAVQRGRDSGGDRTDDGMGSSEIPAAAASGRLPEAAGKTIAGSANRMEGVRYGVSPAVMRGRLLYAPRLQYPMLAKVAHVEGKVVVEAVVGRDGWVSAAKVLSGHRLLRGAALSEVRGRRYRPYTVNDRAMEVATTVTVDFRLHR